jgi:large subunit ribosomal protein L27e
MVKFLKGTRLCLFSHRSLADLYVAGKVVVLLNGRYAGKKAVIVKTVDEGNEKRPYPHAIVAGVEKYPLKINKSMGQKRVAKRSRVHPFVKVVNFNHIMPTR